MKINDYMRKLGWAWLIAAPIVIAVSAGGLAGQAFCQAKLDLAAQAGSADQLSWICRQVMWGKPAASPITGASPLDMASTKIALIAFFVTTLFGLIATLAGYKLFIADAVRSSVSEGLHCALRRDATNGELAGEIVVSAAGRTRIDDLRVEDGAGGLIQAHPTRFLDDREAYSWPIAAPFGSSYPAVGFKGRLTAASGAVCDFEAFFDLTTSGYAIRRLVRTWP